MGSGLDWDGTGSAKRGVYWLSPPPIYDMTYIWRCFPRLKTTQNNPNNNHYYTAFFWGNHGRFDWDSGNTANTFYGCHPYPNGGLLGTPKYWEVSVHSTDVFDTPPAEPSWDRWHIQGFRAWRESAALTHHEFYYDLPDTGKLIDVTVNDATWADADPPTPSIMIGQTGDFGGASWGGYPGWEEFNGVLRGLQFYDALLTVQEMLDEASLALSTAAGVSNIWFLNLDPTPDDVTDKSGQGHHGTWDGAARPRLWSDDRTLKVPARVPYGTAGGGGAFR